MKFLMKSLLCSAVVAAGVAQAGVPAMVERTQYFNAAAHCQASLSKFDDALRKRPLALQNEGTTSAFVTCAIPTQGQVDGLEVYVSSHDGSAAPVACTAVTGWHGGTNYYVTQVTDTASGYAGFYWAASDFVEGATVFPNGYLALSCNLAPGTGLNDFWLHYSETVG
ncbi:MULTISPECIES: hypothetical protein [unclassified Luteimonas]